MEYIDYKEFLKQSEKVQDNFKIWAESNFKEFDLVKLIDEGCILPIDSVLDTSNDDINVGRVFYLGRCICWSSIYEPNLVPLFTKDHLEQFIKDKGYKYIGINNFLECNCKGNQYNIKVFKSMMQLENNIEFYCDTSLECFWKVACKISEI